mgnify:CR=1 FL=1
MITVARLAEMRGCAESTVRKALISNRINGSKHGYVWIIYDDQVLSTWQPRSGPGRPPTNG